MSHLLYIRGFISSAHEREKERGTSRQSFIPFSLSLFACVCIHVSLCYMSVYLLPISEKTEDKTWLPRSVNDPELGPYLNTLVNFMNSAQYINRFKHCLQHQIHQLPNNVSPLQCLPALNVCAHIVAFPSNTMGIVRVAFFPFVPPVLSSIRCIQTFTHNTLFNMFNNKTTWQACEVTYCKSIPFSQTLLTKSAYWSVYMVKTLPSFIALPIFIELSQSRLSQCFFSHLKLKVFSNVIQSGQICKRLPGVIVEGDNFHKT